MIYSNWMIDGLLELTIYDIWLYFKTKLIDLGFESSGWCSSQDESDNSNSKIGDNSQQKWNQGLMEIM